MSAETPVCSATKPVFNGSGSHEPGETPPEPPPDPPDPPVATEPPEPPEPPEPLEPPAPPLPPAPPVLPPLLPSPPHPKSASANTIEIEESRIESDDNPPDPALAVAETARSALFFDLELEHPPIRLARLGLGRDVGALQAVRSADPSQALVERGLVEAL